MNKNKKKLGYTQYENLLAEAHQKIEILAELQKDEQTNEQNMEPSTADEG